MQHPETSFGLTVNGSVSGLAKPVGSAAFRIIQESLTNAIRHADATRIDTRVDCAATGLRIEIADDGRGLNGHPSTGGGLGMRGIQARVDALGGTVQYQAGKLNGLCVAVDLPLENSPASQAFDKSGGSSI